jgi:hypothetical protein
MTSFDLTDIPTSIEIVRSGRSSLHSSSREDYYQALVERGAISNRDDFVSNLELVAEIQRHWQRRSGQIGCRFATVMADDPLKHNWRRIVFGSDQSEVWTEANVGAKIEEAISDPATFALSLIFPEVESYDEFAPLIRYFGNLPSCLIVELPKDEQEEIVRLGIRIQLTESVRAYALAFGPFPELFPLTRQAPFTEIVFPVKPKEPPLRKELTPDPHAAHLADVPIHISEKAWGNLWRLTERLKADILKDSHPGARARVTISLPRKVWEEENGSS